MTRAEKKPVKERDERWETLKRRVQLLARLDPSAGATLRLDEGLVVVRVERVTDPLRLAREIREGAGALSLAMLARSAVLEGTPVVVKRELLAAAQRDLRALEAPPALSLAREHRRALARYGEIGEAWLKKRRAGLAELANELASVNGRTRAAATATEAGGWFERVVDVARAVHGEPSARRLDEARVRLTALGAERRRAAEARFDALIRALETGDSGSANDGDDDAELAELAARLERAGELPGRARRTRVLDVLRKAIAWPDAPASAVAHVAEPLRDRTFAEVVRQAARAIVRALPAARDPEARARALDMLAFYGLAFRIGDDGVPMLSAEDITRAQGKRDEASELFGKDLTLAQAIAVLDLPLKRWLRRRVGGWVKEGLELDLVAEACKQGHADALGRAANVRAARAFATWATKLVPHYKKLGVTFDLSPELFAHLPKNEDVAVLAVCLMEQTRDDKAPAADPMAVLDATLGMFQRLPQKAGGILAALRGTSPGAGARAFPEFSAWLGDDALLDRFVHLTRLAAEPVALTKQLREDFDHEEKATRERAHLEAIARRSDKQEARLSALRARDRSRAAAPRGRTRRRLAERIEQLMPIAYRRELDHAFKEILREAWGITVPAMTEAWRDAVRFWLVVDDNRELFGKLLREAAAAPGRDVKLAFPKNRAWLDKHGKSLNLARWTAPRAAEIRAGEATYTIALEDDPLQVLRMGIPFGTCLALDTGCNAASTVVNAVDVNKRVLYVRGRDGKIVARKLLAVTKELELVGYNLYVATRGPEEREIRAAVDAMCRAISAEVGAPLATRGAPEELHGGFWYDDGTVPWGGDVDVDAYCRALELSVPKKPYEALANEARGRAAMDEDDVEAALAVLTRWDDGPANVMLGAWTVRRLGEREAQRRAKETTALVPAILRELARDEDGMIAALAAATRLDESAATNALPRLLRGFPRSARLAKAVAEMGARAMRVFPDQNDHGMTHVTIDELSRLLDGVEASFDALDRVEPAWAEFAAAVPGCDSCRRGAWERCVDEVLGIFSRAARAGHAASGGATPPKEDAAAVVACLMSRHRGELAQRAALRVATRHVLPGGARALDRLAALRPALAVSADMLAARLRQEDIAHVTSAVAKRLPRIEEPPFEALGEMLFERTGLSMILDEWPKAAPEKWTPGPWELAWLRRHPSSRFSDELDAIARRARGASAALEKLALLGDTARVDAHVIREAEGASLERGPKPAEAQKWKSVVDCQSVARAVREQVDFADRGRMPPVLRRTDVLDRRLLGVAVEVLRAGGADATTRAVALDAIGCASGSELRWDELLVGLAGRGDDFPAIERILDDRVSAARPLSPEAAVALFAFEPLRDAVARALARASGDDWTARVAACERAAERASASATATATATADGLFDAVALAIVEQGAASTAAEVESLDLLRVVVRVATTRAAPVRAAALYEELADDLSASIYVRAVRRLPRDRAAAIRDAAGKLRFLGERGAARKEWLTATRTLKKRPASPIERS